MTNRVVFRNAFRKDLQAHTRRLLLEEREAWVVRLRKGIADIAFVISRHPEVGSAFKTVKARQIRRSILQKLPFVAWYYWDEANHKIIFLRLFHTRQDRR